MDTKSLIQRIKLIQKTKEEISNELLYYVLDMDQTKIINETISEIDYLPSFDMITNEMKLENKKITYIDSSNVIRTDFLDSISIKLFAPSRLTVIFEPHQRYAQLGRSVPEDVFWKIINCSEEINKLYNVALDSYYNQLNNFIKITEEKLEKYKKHITLHHLNKIDKPVSLI